MHANETRYIRRRTAAVAAVTALGPCLLAAIAREDAAMGKPVLEHVRGLLCIFPPFVNIDTCVNFGTRCTHPLLTLPSELSAAIARRVCSAKHVLSVCSTLCSTLILLSTEPPASKKRSCTWHAMRMCCQLMRADLTPGDQKSTTAVVSSDSVGSRRPSSTTRSAGHQEALLFLACAAYVLLTDAPSIWTLTRLSTNNHARPQVGLRVTVSEGHGAGALVAAALLPLALNMSLFFGPLVQVRGSIHIRLAWPRENILYPII